MDGNAFNVPGVVHKITGLLFRRGLAVELCAVSATHNSISVFLCVASFKKIYDVCVFFVVLCASTNSVHATPSINKDYKALRRNRKGLAAKCSGRIMR